MLANYVLMSSLFRRNLIDIDGLMDIVKESRSSDPISNAQYEYNRYGICSFISMQLNSFKIHP